MLDEVEEYVRQHQSMVLATYLDGEVRAATACYAVGEQMAIYFFMFRNSLKHQGIAQSAQVSLVIDEGFTIPMRGVEIVGTAKVVTGGERRHGQDLLTNRFPNLKDVWDDPRILIVRVEPDRVRYTDWRQGVGHSREASVEPRDGSAKG